MPSTGDEWKAIPHDFRTKFKFWKTESIKKSCPCNMRLLQLLGDFQRCLLAVVNANKEFLIVDVGMNGKLSDGGVLFHSKFGELFQEEKLNLPPPLLFSTVLKIFLLFSLETKPSHCTQM